MTRLNADLKNATKLASGNTSTARGTYVVRVADPEVASVPPCKVVRNCEVPTPWLAVKY